MSRQPGDALPALQKRIDRSKRFPDDLLHAHEPAPNALFRELHDRRLGVVDHIFGAVRLIGCPRHRRARGGNQPAQHRLVANDLYVMLNARPVGYALHQARHIRHVADRLQILMPVEFLDQRDHVDRPRRLRQIHHPRINPPVRVQRKILDPQMLRRLVIGKIVQQDRAQNRALGFHIRRKGADRVIGSRQSSLSQCSANRKRTLSRFIL